MAYPWRKDVDGERAQRRGRRGERCGWRGSSGQRRGRGGVRPRGCGNEQHRERGGTTACDLDSGLRDAWAGMRFARGKRGCLD
ncbi:hypothetical protein ACP4OV_007509 [Aristida adscensionis]